MEHHIEQTTPGRQKYNVIATIINIDDDGNDAEVNVLRYGKHFIIHILPSDFRNSPAATTEYLAYYRLLKLCEDELDGIYRSDFYDWAMLPFELIFEDLAPAPAHIPKVSLQDSLFPEFFVFRLTAVDDKLVPQRVETKDSDRIPPGASLPPKALEHLNKWAPLYRPSEVEVSFDNPEDALFNPPEKALIGRDRTTCSFKAISPEDAIYTQIVLEAYENISKADLKPDLRICRLHGVVQSEEGLVCGLLLTYIEDAKLLHNALWPGLSDSLRERWARQLTETLAELHSAGLVWNNASNDSVLIDKEENAWVTGFRGVNALRWIDDEAAGTAEADIRGLAGILDHIDRGGEQVVMGVSADGKLIHLLKYERI